VNSVVIFHAINVVIKREISIRLLMKNQRRKWQECAAKFVTENFYKGRFQINSLCLEEVDLLRLKRNSN
jgi:hypothetical protein